MAIFTGELGLHFVTHLANHYTVPDLVRLAQFAADKGFKHIWVNDNLRYRGQLVVLTAIAAHVPIHLGTAIMVPYLTHWMSQTAWRHLANYVKGVRSVWASPAAISANRPSMFSC